MTIADADLPSKVALGALLLATAALAQAPAPAAAQPTLADRVAAVKQSLAESQQRLRTYEWVETTAVSLKGVEKSRKQERCYYGADGGLQKVPISATPPPKSKPGLRGAIAASKKEELSDYMKQAVALVKLYVPPDPTLIQKSKDAGKASMEVLQPGKLIRLVFRDYRIPGDFLGVSVDLTTNKLVGLNVGTYIEKPSDTVTLNVTFGALNDGTIYPAQIVLDAKAKEVSVAVTNSGYKKNG
jgi:hypothetical protein